jgi:hypothetical protein
MSFNLASILRESAAASPDKIAVICGEFRMTYVPIGSTMRVGVSIFTYCDRITFGVTGDAETVPDVDLLGRAIADDLAELAARARHGKPDPTVGGPGGDLADAVPGLRRAGVTRPRRAARAR